MAGPAEARRARPRSSRARLTASCWVRGSHARSVALLTSVVACPDARVAAACLAQRRQMMIQTHSSRLGAFSGDYARVLWVLPLSAPCVWGGAPSVGSREIRGLADGCMFGSSCTFRSQSILAIPALLHTINGGSFRVRPIVLLIRTDCAGKSGMGGMRAPIWSAVCALCVMCALAANSEQKRMTVVQGEIPQKDVTRATYRMRLPKTGTRAEDSVSGGSGDLQDGWTRVRMVSTLGQALQCVVPTPAPT
eukprot:IDg13168t1